MVVSAFRCREADGQRAFYLRHLRPAAGDVSRIRHELRRRGALVARTVYECPTSGKRLVGERRCPDFRVFYRALGPDGQCPDCDQPILPTELLGMDVMLLMSEATAAERSSTGEELPAYRYALPTNLTQHGPSGGPTVVAIGDRLAECS